MVQPGLATGRERSLRTKSENQGADERIARRTTTRDGSLIKAYSLFSVAHLGSQSMIGSLRDLRKKNRASRSRSTKPSIEGLEDRMLLSATEGAMWQFSSRITYSFVPDGASI